MEHYTTGADAAHSTCAGPHSLLKPVRLTQLALDWSWCGVHCRNCSKCTSPQELAQHNLRLGLRETLVNKHWCSLHCKSWRSMAHRRSRTDVLHRRVGRRILCGSWVSTARSRRWSNTLHHRSWCGWHWVNGERDSRICALCWRDVIERRLLLHIRGTNAIHAVTCCGHRGLPEPREFLLLLTARELDTARRCMGVPRPHCGCSMISVEVDSSHDHCRCVGDETVLRLCLEHVRKGQVCEDAGCCIGVACCTVHWCGCSVASRLVPDHWASPLELVRHTLCRRRQNVADTGAGEMYFTTGADAANTAGAGELTAGVEMYSTPRAGATRRALAQRKLPRVLGTNVLDHWSWYGKLCGRWRCVAYRWRWSCVLHHRSWCVTHCKSWRNVFHDRS